MNRYLILIFLAAMLAACSTTPTPPPAIELSQTFDDSPTGFSFRYPDGWEYMIPMQGLLIAGKAETLYENQPGATFTIQRGAPLSVHGTLDAALDQYLRRGALSDSRDWKTTTEIQSTTFLGREALQVDLQGKENAASPEQRARIVATIAENTLVYLLVIAAPVETWETDGVLLEAMLASVEILE